MTLRTWRSLSGVVPSGTGLSDDTPFFRSHAWYECLVRGLGGAAPQPLVVALDNDAAVRLYGALDRGVLASLTHFYSVDFGPTGIAGAADAEAFAAWLSAHRPRFTGVELRYLASDDPFAQALPATLAAHGFGVEQYFQYENWFLPCAGLTFADYWQSRPSRLRNTVRRKRRKLDDDRRLQMAILTSPDELTAGVMADYTRVYNSSWKEPEPFPDMIPGLLRTAAALGVLRLGMAYVDGECAACQIWVTHAGNAMIYKLAYDERFADLSVGAVLSTHLFEHALDVDQVSVIDYGVGSEPYKREWMSQVRTRGGIRAWNRRTPSGWVRTHVGRMRDLARRIRGNPAVANESTEDKT